MNAIIKTASLWIAYAHINNNVRHLFIEAGEIGSAHKSARKKFGPGVSFSVREPTLVETKIAFLMEKIDGDDPENWG
jgi:hypothetical protein